MDGALSFYDVSNTSCGHTDWSHYGWRQGAAHLEAHNKKHFSRRIIVLTFSNQETISRRQSVDLRIYYQIYDHQFYCNMSVSRAANRKKRSSKQWAMCSEQYSPFPSNMIPRVHHVKAQQCRIVKRATKRDEKYILLFFLSFFCRWSGGFAVLFCWLLQPVCSVKAGFLMFRMLIPMFKNLGFHLPETERDINLQATGPSFVLI